MFPVQTQIPITSNSIIKNKVFEFDYTDYRPRGFVVPPGAAFKYLSFEDCEFIGNGKESCHKGPIVAQYGGSKVDEIKYMGCSFSGLTHGPTVNSLKHPTKAEVNSCLFDNIVGLDAERGKAVSFTIQEDSSVIVQNCAFKDVGRHSVYFARGGRGDVNGCTFVRNNSSGTTTFPLAAISVARGGGVGIFNCNFYGCRDGISFTDDDPFRKKGDIFGADLLFVSTLRHDVYFMDAPEKGGYFDGVHFERTFHHVTETSAIPWALFSFKNVHINGATILDTRLNETSRPLIMINGRLGSENLSFTKSVIYTSRKEPKTCISTRGDTSTVNLSIRLVRGDNA